MQFRLENRAVEALPFPDHIDNLNSVWFYSA